jgi:glycosyltransferase involved in cell wall biosynthesis
MKLLYIANIRIPTEKAHGLQIMQNCEAFAQTGAEVRLWVTQRINTAEMQAVADPFVHYGVQRVFTLERLPTLDLMPLVPGRTHLLARLIFYLQQGTFLLVALLKSLVAGADVIYSRDATALLFLSLLHPRRKLVYEAHKLAPGKAGAWIQSKVVQRVGTVVTVTARLRDDLIKRGAEPARTLTAHDGIRAGRFADLPDQAAARAQLGWPAKAFIVGYVGRLQTMAMDKGVGTLIDALKDVDGVTLALVGGPDDMAAEFHQYWLKVGLPDSHFINAGQVPPERVPLYLRALDVCAMPFPWTEHFAYYASPMKLFEYMVSGRAIVAADLPSTTEVVQHEQTALLYPPGEATALGAAIRRLRDDTALRERLGGAAAREVMAHYTWAARAKAILQQVRAHGQ